MNINVLDKWLNRSFFGYAIIVYLILLAVLSFMKADKVPDDSLVACQIIGLSLVFISSRFYSYRSIWTTIVVVFFFQLIAGYGLRIFNIEFYGDPLGLNPIDAGDYNRNGMHTDLSIVQFCKMLASNRYMLDDYGFNLIVYLCYKLFTPDNGIHVLVFFNAVAVAVSSLFLYKISRLHFAIEVSMFIAFFWGTELFAAYTASVGLKENFMVMFIIISMYYLCKLNKGANIKDTLLFLLFASFALLFRMAIFYMLISCWLFQLSLRFSIVQKHLYLYVTFVVVLAVLYYMQTVDQLAVMRGYSYEILQKLAKNKIDLTGQYAVLTNYVSAMIGPIPNLLSPAPDRSYLTSYSFTPFCKVIYSFFMLYGIYRALKDRRYWLLPMIAFWALDTVMLIFTFFSLHDRYQWPHIPFTIVIASYGFIMWKRNKQLFNFKNAYAIMALLLVMVFNLR
ncbi:MAG: glycosyltransferase family 39 protein [Bacteroidales bacterium]|nr:glycosyltransferase family 39 protein [Bacteroidales bacterium]MDY3912284.1 glycosyltransferase family 39 protein [Sodaliphilus sp.]